MGRVGRVITAFIDKLSGSGKDAQQVAVEEFAGDERKAQVFGPCNEDFAPPAGVETVDLPLGEGAGLLTAAAYRNGAIAPVALPGEFRKFSTNSGGDTVKAEVFLKQDGTILVANDNAVITVSPSGELTIATAGKATLNIGDELEINSTKTTINNPTIINGLLTAAQGIQWGGVASGLTGGTAEISGGLDITGGDVEHDGVSIGKTHPHSGVQSGVDNSGPPV